jgi:membrane protein
MAESVSISVASERPSWTRSALQHTQYPREQIQAVVGRFIDNNDLLWASALTYTSALSIVPLLVLVFSVLKGLGYTDQLEPVIIRYVGSPDIADQLLGFVHNMKVGALGSVGAATLIITDISLMGTIENAFNHSWGVPKGRTWLRKFTDYLSVTFTVPVLLVTAITLTAGVANRAAFLKGLSFVASFGLVWAGFFFLFMFFPNTRVKWRAAVVGSLFTAVLWTLAQWAYVHFQYGVTNYKAYYGALAAIPIFLVWIYFSWAIVLFGVEIAVVVQRGPYRPLTETVPPNFTIKAVFLLLMRIGERMVKNGPPVTPGVIAHEMGVSEEKLTPILVRLQEAGILARSVTQRGSKPSHELLLTRSPRMVRLGDVIAAIEKDAHPVEPRIDELVTRITETERRVLQDVTVLDLVGATENASATSANADGSPSK